MEYERHTAEQLAALVGKSESVIYSLQREGVIRRKAGRGGGYDPLYCVPRILEHYAKPAPEQSAEFDPTDIKQQIEIEKLNKMRLEAAQQRRELIPVSVLRHYAEQAGATIHDGLEALAANIKKRVPGLRASDVAQIKKEIAKVANGVVDFDPDHKRAA